ncbi:MAG: hypothetical protein LBL66_03720, partial [Clostridiales bacterium]|nr:hypothetical protein [Clostridiales bacterium]
GGGAGNAGALKASKAPMHGKDYSLSVTIPPLSVLFFERTGPIKLADKKSAARNAGKKSRQ